MRRAKPAMCIALALACSLATPYQAGAQMFSAAQSNDFSQVGFDIINDVFIGRGSTGPFMLSWKNIESESDSVLIAGRKLTRGQEYTIDYASGMLAFMEPVDTNVMIRVSYHKVANKAVKNGSSLSMPLNAKLVDGDRGSLQMLGFYKGGASEGTGLSVFGLSGDRKLGSSTGLSSTLMFSQGDPNKTTEGGNSLDKAALKFGADTTLGKFALKGNFSRVGENFAEAKQYGLQTGKEAIDLAGTFGKASDTVFASFSYKEQDDLSGKGASQTNQEQKVVLNMPNKTTASASFTSSETSKDGKTTEVDTTKFAVQSSALKNTELRASLQTTESSQNGADTGIDLGMKLTPGSKTTIEAGHKITDSEKDGDLTTTSLRLSTSAIDKVQLSSSLNLKSSESAGEETGYDVGVKIAATKRTSLSASYANVDSEKGGVRTRTAFGVAANPLDSIQLRTDFVMNSADTGANDTRLDVGVKAVSGKRFSMDAAYTGTESTTVGATEKAQVKIAANPVDAVQLQTSLSRSATDSGEETGIDVSMKTKFGQIATVEGAYGGKESDLGPSEERQSFKISAKPADFMSVSAGMTEKVVGTSEESNRDARIEIAPSQRFKLATGYSEAVNGAAITTIHNYSGFVKPSSAMEVSGIYKTRETEGAEGVDTTSVKMALGGSSRFKLTGQYAFNPEDDKGVVKRIMSTTVGLDFKLGILGVNGGYSENEEYLADRLTRETKLGMNVPMFGHGSLSTSYKLAEAISAAEQATTTYAIGYTHIVGSSFNLSLAGEMVQYDQEAMATKSEYKATAKLGMSF